MHICPDEYSVFGFAVVCIQSGFFLFSIVSAGLEMRHTANKDDQDNARKCEEERKVPITTTENMATTAATTNNGR